MTIDYFHFDNNRPSFESLGKDNGIHYWWASDLMRLLGYGDATHFKPILRAQKACLTLNIPLDDNFIYTDRKSEKEVFKDYKLSRFACYLVAMNSDSSKPQVAAAQAYFAALAEAFTQLIRESEHVNRLLARDEITEREKSLSHTAQISGVENYALFQNAGYRGMYNMSISDIKTYKGIPRDRSPLDFMGHTELAANLFRITQTDEKIKKNKIHGQCALESTAEAVGKEVRSTMKRISGVLPEELDTTYDIKGVKKDLKDTYKCMKKLDKKVGKK